HMNEGHAAFLTMERARQLTHSEGLTFEEAREAVRATTLFTTHTPVPAGHDRFDEDLMRRYFSDVSSWAGVPWETFWELGGARGEAKSDTFNMTYLAMNFASFRNGVSKLHGIASRKLFRSFWPERIESEIPVGSVTNGIHLPTWTAPELASVLGASSRPIQPDDFADPLTGELLARFWRTKQEQKAKLLDELRLRTRRSFVQRGDSPLLLDRTLAGLEQDALLIGFARRFAPYKRADLMFRDSERLLSILSDEERPVRILIAGKAHPRDQMGKDILHQIADRTRQDGFVGRVLFLEDYDIELARLLMSGVDVWLNTPTRMLEASGTSGMKAAANGALNLSIGDGWWPEGFDGKNGWLIEQSRAYESQELQDQLDASILYRLLEEEVVPAFFERAEDGLPHEWLSRVAHSLATVPTVFNTDRMVLEYTERAYTPLSLSYADLSKDHMAEAKRTVSELNRLRRGFEKIEILSASVGDLTGLEVGDPVDLRLEARIGELRPEDVLAELVIGHANGGENLDLPHAVELSHTEAHPDGRHVFEGRYAPTRSGRFRYGLRIRDRRRGDFVLWA
ncbi:MAG TPA: alpha-glucan family phosphorylase, partial [Planctomycetes bacterium]|nr:alpha-glucan family phosphorylase [Planctomycetota bacterium]